jgi:hypothetical protein
MTQIIVLLKVVSRRINWEQLEKNACPEDIKDDIVTKISYAADSPYSVVESLARLGNLNDLAKVCTTFKILRTWPSSSYSGQSPLDSSGVHRTPVDSSGT